MHCDCEHIQGLPRGNTNGSIFLADNILPAPPVLNLGQSRVWTQQATVQIKHSGWANQGMLTHTHITLVLLESDVKQKHDSEWDRQISSSKHRIQSGWKIQICCRRCVWFYVCFLNDFTLHFIPEMVVSFVRLRSSPFNLTNHLSMLESFCLWLLMLPPPPNK